MLMNDIIDEIKKSFNGHLSIGEKRKGIFQIFLPFYHEDGDMVELFLEKIDESNYRLSDYGMTLMRLSYSYEINTPTREKIFHRILSENVLLEDNGNIYCTTNKDSIYTSILNIIQTLMKVNSMDYFKRETVKSVG